MQPLRRQELQEAVRAAAAETAANEAELARLRRGGNRQGSIRTTRTILFVGIALLAWIWIAKPAWVFGDRPAPPSPARAEAEIRYGIYLEAALIEDYLQEEGRLPESLAELGNNPGTGITFTAGRGTEYRLSAAGPNGTLAYSSRMNVDSFLGNSLDLLRGDNP